MNGCLTHLPIYRNHFGMMWPTLKCCWQRLCYLTRSRLDGVVYMLLMWWCWGLFQNSSSAYDMCFACMVCHSWSALVSINHFFFDWYPEALQSCMHHPGHICFDSLLSNCLGNRNAIWKKTKETVLESTGALVFDVFPFWICITKIIYHLVPPCPGALPASTGEL